MADFESIARLGLVHFMAYPQVMKGDGPVLETLAAILADPDFEVVEVTQINDAQSRRSARKMLADANVTACFGAQPVLLGQKLNLNALSVLDRRRAIDAVKVCMDQAVELGCTGLAVLAGAWTESDAQAIEALLIESLIELSQIAAGAKLDLTLEIFDSTVDKKAYVGPAAVAQRVGDAVRERCANFGLMPDLSHLPLLFETPRQALPPIAHLITHAHIGNAVIADPAHPRYGDQHPPFCVSGGANGPCELAEYLSVLQQVGYLCPDRRPIISLEVKPAADEDIALVLAGCKRVLRQATAILSRGLTAQRSC